MKITKLKHLIKKILQEQNSERQVRSAKRQARFDGDISTINKIGPRGSKSTNPGAKAASNAGRTRKGRVGRNMQNQNRITNERKNVGGKTLMCCCAWSSGPMMVECINFDSCSDCCLIGTSSGCKGGAPVADFQLTKKR